MSSVSPPNNSDTDRSAVDLNSKQSGDGTEGTADRLNEAPHNHIFPAASYRPVHPLSPCIYCGIQFGELRGA